ncbi:hypothetical protein Adt_39020 [Abeliophyllum distichum]|uniref:Uncharacterized protein n=1 Tax=Abeliophyllum distichum TaxID=126358 RepID=A0ABD1Q3W6_9LAMI
MAHIPASAISLVVEVVGSILPSLTTLSVAPVLSAIVLPIGVIGDDSSSLPSKISMSWSVDVQHQDKGQAVSIDEGEKVAPKRVLKDRGTDVDSRRVKRSRMAPPQETSKSIPTPPRTVQDPLLIRLTGLNVSTLGPVRMN